MQHLMSVYLQNLNSKRKHCQILILVALLVLNAFQFVFLPLHFVCLHVCSYVRHLIGGLSSQWRVASIPASYNRVAAETRKERSSSSAWKQSCLSVVWRCSTTADQLESEKIRIQMQLTKGVRGIMLTSDKH